MSDVAQAAQENPDDLTRQVAEDFGPLGLEVFGLSAIDALRLYDLAPGYSEADVERRCQELRELTLGDAPYPTQATYYLLVERGRELLQQKPDVPPGAGAAPDRELKQSRQGALYFLGLPDDYSERQLNMAYLLKKYAPQGVSVRDKPEVFRQAVEDSRAVLAQELRPA